MKMDADIATTEGFLKSQVARKNLLETR